VEITVSDTGQGIPGIGARQAVPQVGPASVRATKGEKSTGLGLMIAKKIVDLHGRAHLGGDAWGRVRLHVFLPLIRSWFPAPSEMARSQSRPGTMEHHAQAHAHLARREPPVVHRQPATP